MFNIHSKHTKAKIYPPENLNSGNLLKSPPPKSLWSLVSSLLKTFSYSGPASTRPPEALYGQHKPG